MGGREKKLVWLIAAVLAVAMLIAGLTGFVRDEAAWSRFLQNVDVHQGLKCKSRQRVYWNDFLKYTDGYEAVLVQMDGNWTPPESWERGEISLEEAKRQYELSDAALQKLDVPETCQAKFYSRRGEGENEEFFVGLYDGKETMLIYRGHHLYGI